MCVKCDYGRLMAHASFGSPIFSLPLLLSAGQYKIFQIFVFLSPFLFSTWMHRHLCVTYTLTIILFEFCVHIEKWKTTNNINLIVLFSYFTPLTNSLFNILQLLYFEKHVIISTTNVHISIIDLINWWWMWWTS